MRTLCDIQPGQTVGRYEFLLPIAQGGMAAVWAARLKGSRGFSKLVAVKTMLPGFSDEPQFQQMFLDEARLASRIRHPHVAEIYDLGEQDDILYLVLELVDGQPLSAIRAAASKHGGLPLGVAVKIVSEACSGLHAAHELRDELGEPIGLVHRDISPQNLLVTYEGVVKIVDFGVAKGAGRTSAITGVGHVKGKPPYMAPEQALSQAVDRRADIFALGIVLYQVTAGFHPLRGESDLATLQNIISGAPIKPPRKHVPGYPAALEAVVMKALERDPADRFQSARELELALEDCHGPGLPRARAGEAAEFLGHLLGREGQERRASLQQAIRLADQRILGASVRADGFAGSEDVQTVVERPKMSSLSGEATPDVTGVARSVGSSAPPVPAHRVQGRWLAGGALVLAALIATAVAASRLLGSGSGGSEASSGPPAAAAADPRAEPSVAERPAPTAPSPPVRLDGGTESQLTAREEAAPSSSRPIASPRAPRSSKGRQTVPVQGESVGLARPEGSDFVPPPIPDPGF